VSAALLDVDLLLALAWPSHQHHLAAHRWFSRSSRNGWATCSLTELAFVRLSSNPAFTKDAVSPGDALRLLARICKLPGHRRWDELPAVAGLASFALIGHQRVNDAYLVLVARRRGGVLATFDTRIAAWAGAERHVAVIAA
jgi:toxin-antitoxin system PIN domain toxin